jgi:hypothetical protein
MQKSRISVRRKAQHVQSTRQYLRMSRSSTASSGRIARRGGGGRRSRGRESSHLGIAAAVAGRRIQRRAGTGNRGACARAIPPAVAKSSIPPRPACPQSPSPVFPFWAFALPMRLLAAKPYVEHPGDDAHIPIVQRRSLLDLDSRTCRWPVHDPAAPDFFFCGAQSAFGRPYCATHCARAYRAQGEMPTTRERAMGEGE